MTPPEKGRPALRGSASLTVTRRCAQVRAGVLVRRRVGHVKTQQSNVDFVEGVPPAENVEEMLLSEGRLGLALASASASASDEHSQLGQIVTAQDVDRSALDHLGGQRHRRGGGGCRRHSVEPPVSIRTSV